MTTPERHAQLTDLFGEAIALDAAARLTLVARLRAADPALAGELAALLEADALAASAVRTGALAPTVVERPPHRAAGEAATVRGPDDAAAAAPPRIAGYRILGVLGEGGMGTVYAGEQDAPRRQVAIKVLHAASRASFARFVAEAEIMARLDHPGIAKIFEAGQAGGHPFFVMEYVAGQTLDVHVRGRPLAARLRMFAAVCDAVHHAHIKGVFHRDLKPSNVMVRDDGRVAVLDFGIARVAGDGGSSGGDTRAGELIGTPVYMSPEQARLRPDEVDARSDVYTLGVILYELVAGRLPYDVRSAGLADVARAICEDPPRPLPRHDRALRGDLEAICDRALAKQPERRYPSAASLADDVRRHLAGDAVSARVPGAVEQLRRFARRRPALAVAIGGGPIVLASFAAVVTRLWLDARAARRDAEAENARATIAHAKLEERTNQLVLDQARSALASDPTQAVDLLRTLTPRGTDPAEAWAIADEAFGRGVAREVRAGHGGEVRWVEGADAGYVSGGYDGRALRWTYGDPQPRELLHGPWRVHTVRPSPDGRWFAIGGDDGLARIVDAAGGEVAEPGPLSCAVEQVAWSPDGAQLALGDTCGHVVLWSRAGGSAPLAGATGKIESLAWSTDGAAVVAGSDGGVVWSWQPDGAAASAPAGAKILAVWAGGDVIAAAEVDGRVQRWRRAAGQLVPVSTIASGLTCKIAAFAADGRTAAMGGVDGRVARVSEDASELLHAHARQIRAVVVSATGDRVATGSEDGEVRVSDLATGRRFVLRGHGQRVRQLAFTGGAAELLSGDSEGAVRRWQIDRVPPTVFDSLEDVAHLAISADGQVLASADAGDELRRWDLATGGSTRIGRHPQLTALAVGAGLAVSGAADGSLVWWLHGAELRHAIPGRITALAVSRDERWVAAATSAGPIALYTGDGTPVAMLSGHRGGTEAVAVSPDGGLVVSGGQDRVIRVWRTAAPAAPPIELGPIDNDTRQLVFARGGRLVIGSGDDGKVRAWSVLGTTVDPGSMRVLAAHQDGVIALASDGEDRVVSIGRNRGRNEIDLGHGSVRAVPASAASRAPDGPGGLRRALALPIPGGRDLWVTADGKAIVVHTAGRGDLAALRARLLSP